MTAHPKRKITKSRRGKRRAHNALQAIATVPCPQCGETKLPHHVCENCGYYNGKQVIEKETKKKK